MTKEEDDTINIQAEEWQKRCERGEVCGVFGCENTPTMDCPRCSEVYCSEHSFIHIHTVFSGL